ncbi:transglutaminaseTgpA domain-containing protein [Saccharopolyspora shandongensis]|uniref:transglutaminaseTgpA domain-containing protein n=1 Tax=Saccharopolyspora shandongensis TaxID=418495 RepID=UPI00340EB44B
MTARNRLAIAGLLCAAAVSGFLFAPVFGLAPLIVPVLVVVLVGYGCVESAVRWPKLVPWRPVLVLLGALLGLIESVLFPTTVVGVPTGETLRVLERGLTEGWLLTLQSTWPARPDAEQLLFVPLAMLLAVVLGLELLLRLRKPMVALLPGLAVVALGQAYQALTGFAALLAAIAYAVPAGVVLWAERPGRPGARPRGGLQPARRASKARILLVVPTIVGVVAGSVLIGGFDPVGGDPYRLADGRLAPLQQNRLSNPLDQVAARLGDREREVFRYRSDAPVDRWRLVVLDGFDGTNWSTGAQLRRMGTGLGGVPGGTESAADLRVRGGLGPWLPSQPVPVGVTGLAPLVDQSSGALLVDPPVPAGQEVSYRLSWSTPQIDAARLGVAPVDPHAAGGLGGLGVVPPEIGRLARDSVRGLRPTFQAALQLDRFLSENYQVAVGEDLPTGHGWPQLRHFLLESKRGTSEQFAAAYVLLARLNGIPARLVVGFRGSNKTEGDFKVVRNGDVLAWPEVAVEGVGWVPLDPTATATQSGRDQSGLAMAAAQARQQLPPENQLRPPQLPPGQQEDEGEPESDAAPLLWAVVAPVAGVLLLLACWLVGVPLAKAVRARRRKRLAGADGVMGAWAEARDRIRAHGVPYRIGMTPRDLAESAGAMIGERTAQPVVRLAKVLDMALWSGVPVADGQPRRAWEEVREVRRALAARPLLTRLRAALELRTLLPTGRQQDRS